MQAPRLAFRPRAVAAPVGPRARPTQPPELPPPGVRAPRPPAGRRPPPSVRRLPPPRSAAGGGALAGAGGPPVPPAPPPAKVTADDDGDGEGVPATEENVLAKFGDVLSSLPDDMQAALARGALTLGDVRAWLALASTPLLGAVARAVPGFRDRVLGNPRFLLVLAIEELIGCSARMAGEIQGRGDRFWQEINFVASDMSLEIIGDFFIVWLLSPKASFAPRANTAFARAIAGLPAHALQVGSYSLAQRFGALAYRGTQFFGVGFGAAAIGHTLTMAMVSRQKAAAAARGEKPNAGEKELGPVLDTSLAWGWFMGLSSNARYQLVNGFEERVLDALPLPPLAASLATFILRFGNTFLGTAQWLAWAQFMGVQ